MRVLWVTAAVMQLAAVIAYGVAGAGLIFALLQLFVLVTFGLTVLEIAAADARPSYGWRDEISRWRR